MKNNYRFFENTRFIKVIHVYVPVFTHIFGIIYSSYLSKYDLPTYLLLLNITKQAERYSSLKLLI